MKFAVIAEGVCDQQVIENVLVGYFGTEDAEPVVNPVQPPPAPPGTEHPSGGWTLVFQSLRRGDVQQALRHNDYVVIHIDADVQEERGFDVPRVDGGKELSVPDRMDRVIDRLLKDIDPVFYGTHCEKILFAIAVDSIECWLLPLLHTDAKAGKVTGCLAAADKALRKANRVPLSTKDSKDPDVYERVSRDYTKRKKLLSEGRKSPSLALFIQKLEKLAEARETGAQDSP